MIVTKFSEIKKTPDKMLKSFLKVDIYLFIFTKT